MKQEEVQAKIDALPDSPEKEAMRALLKYAHHVYSVTGGEQMSPHCSKIVDDLRREVQELRKGQGVGTE